MTCAGSTGADWPELHPCALQGPIGGAVRMLSPETEADPAAVLVNLLVMFGNAVGSGPHVRVGGDVHAARLFAAVVGKSARARKGQASSLARWLMTTVDPAWSERVLGGFGSGEALVDAVRDPSGDDEGAPDHRALVREGEFARILHVIERDGSTLSPIIRDAWDGSRLAVRTRKSTIVATGAHIGVIGDITIEELRRQLSSTEVANGFANRFTFHVATRQQRLPSGGRVNQDVIEELAAPLRRSLEHSRTRSTFFRTPHAEKAWETLYERIDDDVHGLVGAITARAEAHILRLSLVYALADGANHIDVEHLLAAVAIWDHAVASARVIFAETTGDPYADRFLSALRDRPDDGLDGTEQNELFGGHLSSRRIEALRGDLEARGLVVNVKQSTGGRPRIRSFIAEEAEKAEEGLLPGLLRVFPLSQLSPHDSAA
jgi:hypothetical protein